MRQIILSVINVYQRLISPVMWHFGARCRFQPSCSEYTKQAFIKYPFWRAGVLASWRLLRCGPWSEGGIEKI